MFGNLKFLWLLWLIPMLLFFYMWAANKKNILIEQFVSKDLKDKLLLGFSKTRQKFKIALLLMAITFSILIVALSGPQWGYKWEKINEKGVDIMIALDCSKSMLAEDVSPNRLERAKREIIDLINLLQGDRLGLVAFAGTSFIQSPLTLDYGAVKIFLDDLDTELIPVPGTAIADAIEKSIKAFDPDDGKSRVIILITDGEDHEGDINKTVSDAVAMEVKIFTIGLGSIGGSPIPLYNARGEQVGFKKDREGNAVLTKLDEETLKQIASAANGEYYRGSNYEDHLDKIYEELSELDKTEFGVKKVTDYEDRFYYFLAPAILLLLAEFFISENKNQWVSNIIKRIGLNNG